MLMSVAGWRVVDAAVGGCTYFITTPHVDGEIATVGWGQGCVSVLGLVANE